MRAQGATQVSSLLSCVASSRGSSRFGDGDSAAPSVSASGPPFKMMALALGVLDARSFLAELSGSFLFSLEDGVRRGHTKSITISLP